MIACDEQYRGTWGDPEWRSGFPMTDCYVFYPQSLQTQYVGSEPYIAPVPKNWRWYHVFMKTIETTAVQFSVAISDAQHRIQERWPMLQRKKQKRKLWLRTL